MLLKGHCETVFLWRSRQEAGHKYPLLWGFKTFFGFLSLPKTLLPQPISISGRRKGAHPVLLGLKSGLSPLIPYKFCLGPRKASFFFCLPCVWDSVLTLYFASFFSIADRRIDLLLLLEMGQGGERARPARFRGKAQLLGFLTAILPQGLKMPDYMYVSVPDPRSHDILQPQSHLSFCWPPPPVYREADGVFHFINTKYSRSNWLIRLIYPWGKQADYQV